MNLTSSSGFALAGAITEIWLQEPSFSWEQTTIEGKTLRTFATYLMKITHRLSFAGKDFYNQRYNASEMRCDQSAEFIIIDA